MASVVDSSMAANSALKKESSVAGESLNTGREGSAGRVGFAEPGVAWTPRTNASAGGAGGLGATEAPTDGGAGPENPATDKETFVSHKTSVVAMERQDMRNRMADKREAAAQAAAMKNKQVRDDEAAADARRRRRSERNRQAVAELQERRRAAREEAAAKAAALAERERLAETQRWNARVRRTEAAIERYALTASLDGSGAPPITVHRRLSDRDHTTRFTDNQLRALTLCGRPGSRGGSFHTAAMLPPLSPPSKITLNGTRPAFKPNKGFSSTLGLTSRYTSRSLQSSRSFVCTLHPTDYFDSNPRTIKPDRAVQKKKKLPLPMFEKTEERLAEPWSHMDASWMPGDRPRMDLSGPEITNKRRISGWRDLPHPRPSAGPRAVPKTANPILVNTATRERAASVPAGEGSPLAHKASAIDFDRMLDGIEPLQDDDALRAYRRQHA